MKKSLSVLTAMCLVSTPVMAHDRYGEHHNNSAPLIIGGLIVGAIIGSELNHHREPHYEEHQEEYHYQPRPIYQLPQPQYYIENGRQCVNVASWRYNQYGPYVYWTQYCN
jgi:hypothetical protein